MFPKQPRRSGRIIRTMIVGRRGGAAAGQTSAGPQTYYVASAPGGRADLEISLVDGVPQAPVGLPGRSVEFFSGTPGVVTTLEDGFGWNLTGQIVLPHVRLVAEDDWETYALGAISAAAIHGGTGWNGAAAVIAY